MPAWFLLLCVVLLGLRIAQVALRYRALRTTGRDVRWEWPIQRLSRRVRARVVDDA